MRATSGAMLTEDAMTTLLSPRRRSPVSIAKILMATLLLRRLDPTLPSCAGWSVRRCSRLERRRGRQITWFGLGELLMLLWRSGSADG